MKTSQKPTSAEELRKFALVTGGMLALIFGMVLPWLFGHGWPTWPWFVGGVLVFWGLVAPASLAPVHKAWMKFAEGLGWVNSRIILTFVFYVIFVPAGFALRLLGKDPMARRLDRGATTYRVTSAVRGRDNLEKPF